MTAQGAGAEAELRFQGVAVALVGPLSQDGGQAEVRLDGEKVGEMDAYIVERTSDNDLWHTYGLNPGAHTLQIITRDTADPRSKGKTVAIARAITYRAR